MRESRKEFLPDPEFFLSLQPELENFLNMSCLFLSKKITSMPVMKQELHDFYRNRSYPEVVSA